MTNQLSRRLAAWAALIALVLSVPLIAMQFTTEVRWELSDFIIMGTVLAAIALAYELVARRSLQVVYRLAFAFGILGAFLLFWVNGAVGIIGSEDQPVNLLYDAVFLTGVIGALWVRFKAKGMARTLYAVATVQLLVPVAGLYLWPPPETSWAPGVLQVFVMNAFFALLFLVSGALFQRAHKR